MERTWHRSDYARFSAAIRRSRHLMDGPYSPNAAEHQAKVDELAEAIAAIFKADPPGHRHRQVPCDDITTWCAIRLGASSPGVLV